MYLLLPVVSYSLFVFASSVPIKNCTRDANPLNGRALSSGKAAYTTVKIECNHGYQLTNKNRDSRVCEPIGQWSGLDDDFCELVPCLDAVKLPNNSVITREMPPDPRYGAVVNATCVVGYEQVSGGHGVRCNANGAWDWTLGIIACQKVQCPDPSTPQNGSRSATDGFNYQSNVVFSCLPGFQLEGDREITCRAERTWNWTLGAVTCRKIECPALGVPDNGSMSATDGFRYQSRVMFLCELGFELAGDEAKTCRADKSWSGAAGNVTCRKVECPDPGIPENGTRLATEGFEFQSRLVFSCQQGFELEGDREIICEANKTWSWTWGNVSCQKVECPDPGTPENGSRLATDGLKYQSRITFSCGPGFQLEGKRTVACRADKQWSNPLPNCK